MKSRFLPLILIVIGLGIGLIIHYNLKNLAPTENTSAGQSLGLITALNGTVEVLPYGANSTRTLTPEKETELHHLDMLQTGSDAAALIKLPSGYELEIQSDARVLFETWGAESSAPTYIHMISGNYKMIRAGQRGQVFVQQNRKLIYPEGNVFADSYYLSIKAPEFVSTKSSSEEVEELEGEGGATKPVAAVPTPTSGPKGKDLPETLSNDEIDQVLANQRLAFERCQTNALRENLPAQGKILVGISITPAGKIQNVRSINSDLNNPSFQNCIISVFQRVEFRAFKGPTITRSYPLVFD